MIKPTIGRVVLFHPKKNAEVVFPALVCFVHNDSMINVGGFDNNGNAFGSCSVRLIQDGEEAPNTGPYAEWMPYQKGQAAKTEDMEKQVKEALDTAKVNLDAVKSLSGMSVPVLSPDDDMPVAYTEREAVVPPAEVDNLMDGSIVTTGMAEPSAEGTETKE